jgi:hypothetical protein
MPAALSTPSSPHTAYSLTQIDTLHEHAHRVVLYGHLLWTSLQDYEPEKDVFMEAVIELVDAMMTEAQAVETVLEQGDRVAAKGGA